MAKTHKCDACGGSGVGDSHTLYCVPERVRATFVSPGACYHDPCPVCLGAGSFSDQMPAKDAMADAETLCNYLRRIPIEGNERNFGPLRCTVAFKWPESLWVYPPNEHGKDATFAANEAFRAIPGLRGRE